MTNLQFVLSNKHNNNLFNFYKHNGGLKQLQHYKITNTFKKMYK